MNIDDILKGLGNLNLEKLPEDDAKSLIQGIGQCGSVLVTLHPGKTLMRARSNYDGERFTTPKELSYKPAFLNKTYQRASTPRNTMFYASFNSEIEAKEDSVAPQLICAFETFDWLRDPKAKGIQTITFGRWVVSKPINLIAIVNHKDFYEKNVYTAELFDAFNSQFTNHPLKEKSLKVLDFFAKHYANEKANSEHSYLYMLSGMFSEMVLKNKDLHGVIYPSVRVDGKSFNLAMCPDVANNNIELIAAGESTIYKYLQHATIDHVTVTKVDSGAKTFEVEPVESKHHKGFLKVCSEWSISPDDFNKECTISVRDFK